MSVNLARCSDSLLMQSCWLDRKGIFYSIQTLWINLAKMPYLKYKSHIGSPRQSLLQGFAFLRCVTYTGLEKPFYVLCLFEGFTCWQNLRFYTK